MYKGILLLGLVWPFFSFAVYNTPDTFLNDKTETKVLVFLSEKCPCSISHINHLNDLVEEHSSVKFYGVISEPAQSKEQEEMIQSYFTKENFKFPIISDPKQTLVSKYKALKTPHVTLINKGKILYQGGLTSNKSFKESGKRYLSENLKRLKKGLSVKYKNGSCLGCYIRRRK
ncbi:MAG: redoxin domain-containing protein [Bdellovibrionales bacterium]